MRFEIPLADGRIVYMQGAECDIYSIVLVSTESFFKIWDASQRDDRSSQNWYVSKYKNTTLCFEQSAKCPVALSNVADIFDYNLKGKTLRLGDGITRIQWLADNGAQSFPILCPHRLVSELLLKAGSAGPYLFMALSTK